MDWWGWVLVSVGEGLLLAMAYVAGWLYGISYSAPPHPPADFERMPMNRR